MSDLPILKEIENNTIVSVETLENNKPVIFNISYNDRKEIIIDVKELFEKYTISPSMFIVERRS